MTVGLAPSESPAAGVTEGNNRRGLGRNFPVPCVANVLFENAAAPRRSGARTDSASSFPPLVGALTAGSSD